jgi:phosphomethylpyrimidine synthase
MRWSIKWGSDTVMDVSTGRIHDPRWIIRSARADWDGSDLSGARESRRQAEELTWKSYDTLIEQAEQGID